MLLKPFIFLGIFAANAWGQLALKDGSIVFASNGRDLQLTRPSTDYDASLSCDGQSAVFVRRGPRRPAASEGLGDRDGNELWAIFGDDPTSARQTLANTQDSGKWLGLITPQLSVDGESIFFMNWFGNGYSLSELSLRSGRAQTIAGSVTDFWVLCSGPFRGGVAILEDHLKLAGGHMLLYWLYTKDGRKLLIGTTDADLQAILGVAHKNSVRR
jgi:hypothetical protein